MAENNVPRPSSTARDVGKTKAIGKKKIELFMETINLEQRKRFSEKIKTQFPKMWDI